MRRYQYEQTAPQQQLSTFLGQAYGYPGETSTQLTPYYQPSTGQTFLGGAASLAGVLGDQASPQDKLLAGLLGGAIAQF